MKQKGFIIPLVILGIVVFVIVVAGAFYVGKTINTSPDIVPIITSTPKPSIIPGMSPAPTTSDGTANWKTYTGEKLGFSIKYPENMTLSSSTNAFKNGDAVFVLKGEENNGNAENSPQRSIELDILFRGAVGTTVLEALKKETPTGSGCLNDPVEACNPKTEKVQFNNVEGINVIRNSSVIDYYVTDINRTRPVIRIILDNNKNIDTETVNLFKEMVRTFKFLE